MNPAAARELAKLRDVEEQLRSATDFARVPSVLGALGADPYRIAALPGGRRFAGLLRGRSALVLLDESMREIARAPGPTSSTGLAVAPDGTLVVSGELDTRLFRFREAAGTLVALPPIDLGPEHFVRDVAFGPEATLYALDERRGLVTALQGFGRGAPRMQSWPIGHGAFRLARAGPFLLTNCLLDHALVVQPVDPRGLPLPRPGLRVVHDGPIWSFAALAEPGGLLLALGGVEDHPLDRTIGSFGYVDSFVYLYRVRTHGTSAVPELRQERLAAVNVSVHGAITPKAVTLALEGADAVVEAVGYGGEQKVVLRFARRDLGAEPRVETRPFVPGVAERVRLDDGRMVSANSLLDAWMLEDENTVEAAPYALRAVPDPEGATRTLASRLGEALIFTTLIAPANRSDGPLSRFTCETCHFEGHSDGRIHYTGRGEVRVTTKPLLGLFANRPYFSRAVDYDLTEIAHNEFAVAGMGSGTDPWFTLATREHPWLASLGVVERSLSPLAMREAFLRFLVDFNPRPNPAASTRDAFTPLEQSGARAFLDRCERCHAARTASDLEATRVPFEAWESAILTPTGAITWGKDEYRQVGVLPYVHARGARVPALRRVSRKWPYFTNGSADGLDAVLARARFDVALGPARTDPRFFHDGAPDDPALARLSETERRALRAFLELL